MELHDILGVSPEATPEAVKKAYRKRAAKLHPDNAQTGDAEEFKRVTSAWLVLRDPARRAHYERTGDTEAGGVDQVRQAALALLGGLIQGAMLDANAGNMDVLKLIRDRLKNESRELTNAQRLHGENKKKAERNAGRWRRKRDDSGEPDLIAAMAASVVIQCEMAVSKCAHEIAVRAAACEILDGYEYEWTKPKEPDGLQFYKGTIGGFTRTSW